METAGQYNNEQFFANILFILNFSDLEDDGNLEWVLRTAIVLQNHHIMMIFTLYIQVRENRPN